MNIIEPLIHEIQVNDVIEMSIYGVGSVISALLAVLSISACRTSGLKKLGYAAFAFALFCGFLIYELLEQLLSLDNPYTNIITPSSALAILILFFLAVVKKS